MTTPVEAKRLAWVSSLSELTCPGRKFPREDQMLFAKMLADYPAAAFTEASLQDVACGLMQFPGIKLLRERLAAWWADNQPRPRLEGPSGGETAATKRWFSTWPDEDEEQGWLRRRLLYWERDAWLASLTMDEATAIMNWLRDGAWTPIAAAAVQNNPAGAFFGHSRVDNCG